MIKILFLFLNITIVISSMLACTYSFNGVIKKRHTSFGMDLVKDAWQAKRFRGADLFIEHESKQAMILVNSQCESVNDSPLPALTAQLLVGLSDINYLKQSSFAISEREGLLSEIKAKLDGVERYLKILVLRKNRCVYDIVFSSPSAFSYLAKDFDQMLNTFWAEAEL